MTLSCCVLSAESNGLAHDLDCHSPLNGETWQKRADARRDWLASELKRQFPGAPIEDGTIDARTTEIMVRSASHIERPLPIAPRCLCGEIDWKTISDDEQNEIWNRAVAKGVREPREPKTKPLTFCRNCGTTLSTFTAGEIAYVKAARDSDVRTWSSPDAKDICACGDYRIEHDGNGAGPCLLNGLGHSGAPVCAAFRLADFETAAQQ